MKDGLDLCALDDFEQAERQAASNLACVARALGISLAQAEREVAAVVASFRRYPHQENSVSEWSKPEKRRQGGWISHRAPREDPQWKADATADAFLCEREGDEGLIISNRHAYAVPCPRDVVLRLLAAEASERLGWVWRPYRVSPVGPLHMSCAAGDWWFDDGTSGAGTPVESPPTFRFHALPGDGGALVLLTPDELCAALHGRYLLEDAMGKGE